ncbi:MAG: response regulator [Ignavibacteriales bacterium]|nr:response regulator [Ignavibacteriales bacterium]
MVLVFLFLSVILFVIADLAVRSFTRKVREKHKRREREEALAVSLKLDFTREAKSLKRASVEEPVARILCVDDEEVILDSFRKILVLDGYSVDTVQTGQEALGLIQTHHYDFVFTDLKMPSMDGLDVVKSVKHMRPDIDVVVITGYATVETAVEGMKHGAMDYVQKPFTEDELLAFVKKALIKRQDRIQKQLKPKVNITHMPNAERVRTGEFAIPGGVLISQGHCWASLSQEGSAKIGLDDFAKKLIGHVDEIEFPNVGMQVKAGQPLFSVRQKHRRVQFQAPISGQVVKINQALSEDCDALDMTPYQKNWVCIIDGDALDAEVPGLKIGRSAVALFQDDIDRFRALMIETGPKNAVEAGDDALHLGELELLDDTQWDRVVKEFFRR